MYSGGGSSSQTQKTCQNCKENHDRLDCPLLPCSRCSGTGHTRGSPCISQDNVQICFKCGNTGHLAETCTNMAPVGRCGVCGGFGHGGPANKSCATKPNAPMCSTCGTPHQPQECERRKDEFPDWHGLDACTQCGKKDHTFPNCPSKYLSE